MKHIILSCIIACCLFGIVGAEEGSYMDKDAPFGLRMGMTVEEIKAIEGVEIDSITVFRNGKSFLTISKAPSLSPDFKEYILSVSPKHGLYVLVAYSDYIPAGNGGSNIMPKYMQIREKISSVYNGYTRRKNYITSGPAWESGEDWVDRISRSIGYEGNPFETIWSPGAVGRSKTVSDVNLHISATIPPRIAVVVEFRNFWTAAR